MSSLGATDTQVSALTQGASTLEVTSAPAPRTIQVPFAQVITRSRDYELPLTEGLVKNLTTMFESVKFISLRFSVEVTGQNGKLYFAATPNDGAPATDLEWLSATVYQRFSGNAHGDTYADYVFPSDHPFGHELKATVLGNPHPRLYFRFKGSSGDSASIRGLLVVQGGGHGIIGAVRLTEIVPTKSAPSE